MVPLAAASSVTKQRRTFLDRPRGTSARGCPLAAWCLSGFLQTGWKGNQRWAQFKRTQRPNAKQLQLLTSPRGRFNWPEQWNVNCGTCVVISKPLRVFFFFGKREWGGNKQKKQVKTKTFGKACERTSAGSALAHATRHRSVKSALIRSDMYRQITFKHEGNSSLQKRSVSAHAPFYRGTEAIVWVITVTTAPLKIPGGKSTNIKTIYFFISFYCSNVAVHYDQTARYCE